MRKSPTSDADVSRLKSLLFDEEQKALAEVKKLVGRHHERIGTDKRFQHSVAEIIADALRDAEVSHHRELAVAISPVVVAGIRREIANSRDEMVDALYPILGRLVAAYVSNAVSALMDEANARLESRLSARRLRLRLESLFTGRPYNELLLARAQRFQVQEILLIRRGSGILLDRWQSDPSEADAEADDQSLVSGVLTAITDFAEEAFADEATQLRTLDIGTARVHLRATPAHLLALICVGAESGRFRKRLDEELFRILEEYSDVLGGPEGGGDTARLRAILPTLAERLSSVVEEEKQPPILAAGLLVLVAACIAGWLGWSAWRDFQISKIRARVESVIAEQGALGGYPLTVRVAADRSRVSLTGLAPSPEAGAKLVASVAEAIRPVRLDSTLAFVAGADDLRATGGELSNLSRRVRDIAARADEIEARLAKTATGGALSEVSGTVQNLAGRLDAAEERLAAAATREMLQTLAAEAAVLRGKIGEARELLGKTASARAVSDLSGRVRDLASRLDGVDKRVAKAARRETLQTLAADAATLRRLIEEAQKLLGKTATAGALSGVANRVQQISGRLDDAEKRLGGAVERKAFESVATDVRSLAQQIRKARERLASTSSRRAVDDLSAEIGRLDTKLAGVEGRLSLFPQSSRVEQLAASVRDLSAEIGDPLRRLRRWTEANAIFFSEETDFRAPERARERLETLSRLVMATKANLRVVGYTDGSGGPRKNETLAPARARRVADELFALGVPRERVIVLGRVGGPYLNEQKGPDSDNRRVEFELAFQGERPRTETPR